MRILAIRGRNLASLAGEFAVNFQSEPLASAGLYAITGPTGAGKSTLLDALCVALYERTPRLARATARGEAIPDVGDSGVAPSDPRTLLRRGASEGYAEVDFVGGDGVAYRSRWSVRRARNKAEGKLQGSEVTLERIADGQLLGDHRKSETLHLIESKIGLNFDQFTRAVLLAQNDFATFLKASDDERAELLQTLTGTGTFTELSRLAYARMKTEKETLDRLRTQLADQAPMAAELRGEKDAAARQGVEQQKALDAARERCEQQLRWHDQWGKLKAAADEAAQQLAAALAARGAAAERYRRLALSEAVEPARPLAAEVDRLEQEIAAAAKALAAGEQQALAARQVAVRWQAAVDAAGKELASAEQARSASLPQIEAARALDALIEALAPQHAAAVKADDEARREHAEALARQQVTQSQLQGAQAALAEGQLWLAHHVSDKALAEGWQRWEAMFAQAGGQEGEARRLATRIGELCRSESAIAAQLQLLVAQHAQQAAAASAARAELAQRTLAWQVFDGDEMLRRKQRLDLRRDQLVSASALWAALGEHRLRHAEVEKERRDGSATIARCTSTEAALDVQRPRLELEYAAALRALELAQLAASAGAESLRALLQDGAPCPVCGGVDHPYAQHEPRADAMLATLADNVETNRQALAVIDAQRVACRTESEGASRQQARLEIEAAAIASTIAERERGWAETVLHEELASVADEARAAWFAGQLATVNAVQQQLHGEEEGWRAAIRQRDAAQATLDLAQQALAAAQSALALGENEQTSTRQALTHARQQLAASETQLAASLDVLDGAFDDQDWRTRWLASPDDFVTLCRGDAEAWTARSRQVGESSARIASLSVVLASQAEICARAAAARQASAERLVQIDGERQARWRERQALLGGRAVKEVDAALAQAVDAARQSLGQQQSKWQQANAELARGDEAQRQAALLLQRRQRESDAAHQRLAAWLSAFNAACGADGGEPLAPATLAALLAVGADWQREERSRLQAIEQAVDSAQAVCEAQNKALAAQAVARPPGDPEATTLSDDAVDDAADAERAKQALAAIRTELGALADTLANLRAELVADDARREKTRLLGETIDQQGGVAHVWSQLGELIGSADGKKFRNFAQQLTLDILLGYGNRQLENLSRRYRLERVKDGLGLLVVDQEMGDEVRSVHTLSGGESFLVSLALALGLASLSSHRVRVESLFIDEGFGSLDADSLRVAMDALDALQAQGRKVGVISHVAEMTERIGVRVQVKRQAGGQSRVSVV